MLPKIGTACYSLNTGRLDLQLVTTAAPVSKVKVSIRLARYREYAVCRPGAAVHQLRLYPLRLLFQRAVRQGLGTLLLRHLFLRGRLLGLACHEPSHPALSPCR